MRDFTLHTYERLLRTLQVSGYEFISFADYCKRKPLDFSSLHLAKSTANSQEPIANLPEKFVILRHDVDLKAENSFKVASCELRVASSCKSSYYFRTLPESNQPEIIKRIAAMGHEVGYHYEDMSLCGGNPEKAVEHFKEHLAKLNATLDARHKTLGKSIINDELLMINDRSDEETQHADISTKTLNSQPSTLNCSLTSEQRRATSDLHRVRTISMHGSVLSRCDNRELWKYVDYRDLGIIGEAYYDVDWNDVFYITDTGRRWDGWRTSVRDRIPGHQERWIKKGVVYRTTEDIIRAVEEGTFPTRVMMTTHPQRWMDECGAWCWELVAQNLKNVVKVGLIRVNCFMGRTDLENQTDGYRL